MKTVMMLDDFRSRHTAVKPYLCHDEAFTAAEAIGWLQRKCYDAVFLDHDLRGQEMVPSEGEEETGYTVAKWMAEHRPAVGLVVVHSMNPPGAANMAAVLRPAGYWVKIYPFHTLKDGVVIRELLG
jgi:hypothetical protein